MPDVTGVFEVANLDAAFEIKSNRHSKFNKSKKREVWEEKPRSARRDSRAWHLPAPGPATALPRRQLSLPRMTEQL